MVLGAVVVRGVDHEALAEPGRAQLVERRADARLRVVGLVAPAAQDDVPVGVAGRVHDRRDAADVDAGERVARGGGAHGVDGDLHVAVGAVLEADGHREARAELTVDLALGRTCADRRPGDGVGDVLRRDRVEELAADRQPEPQHLEQQLARHPHAGVDVAGVVEMRVVDQALPAGRGARLLEVHAHRDQQVVLVAAGLLAQPPGVLERGVDVVHAARADDDEQPVVGAGEDRLDDIAAAQHDVGQLGLERQALEHVGGGRQRRDARDAQVADARHLVRSRGDHPHVTASFCRAPGAACKSTIITVIRAFHEELNA